MADYFNIMYPYAVMFLIQGVPYYNNTWTIAGVITEFILDVNESGELISNFARIDSRACAQQRTDRGRYPYMLTLYLYNVR